MALAEVELAFQPSPESKSSPGFLPTGITATLSDSMKTHCRPTSPRGRLLVSP